MAATQSPLVTKAGRSGGSGGSPAVIVRTWRRVTALTADGIVAAYAGSSSASVWSTPPSFRSSMAMPMSMDITLLVTEKTFPVVAAELW